jgi:hypothetical protein
VRQRSPEQKIVTWAARHLSVQNSVVLEATGSAWYL